MNRIAIFLALVQFALLSQTIVTDEQAKEFTSRWRVQHRARYLVRVRTAGAEKPPITSLTSLVDSLERRGFHRQLLTTPKTKYSADAHSKVEMRVLGNPFVAVTVRLWADVVEAEDRFLYNISSISLAATPGTPDRRLLGDNAAYWPSKLIYCTNNVTVFVSCGALLAECLDHATFIDQAIRNAPLSQ
jgi:hypothetical protein